MSLSVFIHIPCWFESQLEQVLYNAIKVLYVSIIVDCMHLVQIDQPACSFKRLAFKIARFRRHTESLIELGIQTSACL